MMDSEDIHEVDTSGIEAGGEKDAAPLTYEIGFHLLPSVEEGDLAGEVAVISDLLKKLNVEIVGERAPVRIPLAYAMDKKIEGVIRHFDEAYFGWIAGVLLAEDVAKITLALDNHPNVLRYLITKTSKDAVAATLNDPALDIGAMQEEMNAEDEVSDKDLDDALEALEGEDSKEEVKEAE